MFKVYSMTIFMSIAIGLNVFSKNDKAKLANKWITTQITLSDWKKKIEKHGNFLSRESSVQYFIF